MKPNRMIWLAVAALMIVSLGCTISGLDVDTIEIGDLQRRNETVEAGDAEKVRVYIKMGAGDLEIDGGAEDLMEAEFIYNVDEWDPEVEYSVDNGEGKLDVSQPKIDKITTRADIRYEWRMAFSDNIPLNMRIEAGAGKNDIDLEGIDVTQLDLKIGAGEVSVNLSDNPNLEMVDIDVGAGSATIDLAGDWERDTEFQIQGGVGQVSLILPDNVGVRVEVTKGLGDVDTSGLFQRDGIWVNDAYDTAEVVLDIEVQAGVGRVVLEVQE